MWTLVVSVIALFLNRLSSIHGMLIWMYLVPKFFRNRARSGILKLMYRDRHDKDRDQHEKMIIDIIAWVSRGKGKVCFYFTLWQEFLETLILMIGLGEENRDNAIWRKYWSGWRDLEALWWYPLCLRTTELARLHSYEILSVFPTGVDVF